MVNKASAIKLFLILGLIWSQASRSVGQNDELQSTIKNLEQLKGSAYIN